jgi:hypothetical protein
VEKGVKNGRPIARRSSHPQPRELRQINPAPSWISAVPHLPAALMPNLHRLDNCRGTGLFARLTAIWRTVSSHGLPNYTTTFPGSSP